MVKARSAPLSLRANFSWTFVGNVVYAGCQWGMLSALAKLGTPEMVGRFSLGLAITAPVIMFTNLQLRAVQATDAEREYTFGDYLGLRLIMTALSLLIIAGITFVTGYPLETALVILVVGLAKAFEAISDVFYGLLQQRERMDRIAQSMIFKGLLSLGVLTAVVYLTDSVLWGTVGLAATWALVLLTYDIRSGALILKLSPDASEEPLRPRWATNVLLKLAWLSLPLGAVMMLISLNTNIPRYIVERYLGERALGIFAAMAYLLVATNTIIRALGQSASPRLAQHYMDDCRAEFIKLLVKLMGIGALIGAAGLLVVLGAGQQLLTILYQPEYAEHLDVFTWLAVAAGILHLASFLSHGMIAARRIRVQLPLFLGVTIVLTLSCFLLIPRDGLRGAALAMVIAAIVQVTGSFLTVLQALRTRQRVDLRSPG
jgi:O-antigen/teichoic acid export membrane protein